MGGRLMFKGDKKKPKKKKTSHNEGGSSAANEDVEGWIDVPNPSEAHGPVFITQKVSMSDSSQPRVTLSIQPEVSNKVLPSILPSAATLLNGEENQLVTGDDLDDDNKDGENAFTIADEDVNLEPSDINHVWVCTHVVDSDSRVTLRSRNGRFLASDEIGRISCDREARGPQEEWELVSGPDGKFALKGYNDKFLSVDEVAGSKLELRCDSESIEQAELWLLRMQDKYLKEIRERNREKSKSRTSETPNEGYTIVSDLKGAESDSIKKFQSRGAGRVISSEESSRELKRARKEGKLNEAMLDRRVKLKSDRYC